jgi:hypothetical protein
MSMPIVRKIDAMENTMAISARPIPSSASIGLRKTENA